MASQAYLRYCVLLMLTLWQLPLNAHDSTPIVRTAIETAPKGIPQYLRDSGRYTLSKERFWPNGKVVKVAFRGGNDRLRIRVAQTAPIWSKYGNIKFDFGDIAHGKFNEWDELDDEYSAEVRITFDEPGFWSAIGKDSLDTSLFPPDQASMNLDLEDVSDAEGPTAIIHEFGHVCGFLHEHQRPDGACEKEFRWDDDVDYQATRDKEGMLKDDPVGRKPGVYSWLAGPPNGMSRSWIDRNIKAIPKSSAYILGPNDKYSIMQYHFPEFFYKRGKHSPCYAPPTTELSAWDKKGVARAYPF